MFGQIEVSRIKILSWFIFAIALKSKHVTAESLVEDESDRRRLERRRRLQRRRRRQRLENQNLLLASKQPRHKK